MEPILHIQRVVDKQAKDFFVENDANLYTVSAPKKVEWLEAITAVTSYIETQQHKGRDD